MLLRDGIWDDFDRRSLHAIASLLRCLRRLTSKSKSLQDCMLSRTPPMMPMILLATQTRYVPDRRLATNDPMPEEQARCHSLHSRHRGAAADPSRLIRRASVDIRSVNSSILERNSLRIGEVFELL
jgi:hypothetical protein